MLKVSADKFARFMQLLEWLGELPGKHRGPIPPPISAKIDAFSKDLVNLAETLELPVTADAAKALGGLRTGEELLNAISTLDHCMHSELRGKTFYGIEKSMAQYMEQDWLFGEGVFLAFPSASTDIYEAGMCLAFERGTACAMHLFRVVEIGLRVVAADLGISPQNDWGAYLRQIDHELERRFKTSGARSQDEKFYSEAHITIDAMRRAWRNPTMHPEKVVTPTQAKAILDTVRSFMQHLSNRLKETPQP